MPWITALQWRASEDTFEVTADVREVLDGHGPGVYTVVVWAPAPNGRTVISEYSIFHETPPPAGWVE